MDKESTDTSSIAMPSSSWSKTTTGPKMRYGGGGGGSSYTTTTGNSNPNFQLVQPTGDEVDEYEEEYNEELPEEDMIEEEMEEDLEDPIGDHMQDGYSKTKKSKGQGGEWITRRFLTSKVFSFAQAQGRPGANVDLINPEIFKKRHATKYGKSSERKGDLSTCMIHSVSVKAYSNNFPTDMCADISGIPGNAYTKAGDRTGMLLLRNGHSAISHDYKIHIPLAALEDQNKMRYAGISEKQLLSELTDRGGDYFTINKGSGLEAIITERQRDMKFPADVSECRTPIPECKENRDIAIDKRFFTEKVYPVLQSIITNLAYKNLGGMQVTFYRSDLPKRDESWTNTGGDLEEFEDDADDYLTKKCKVSMVVEIKYKICSLGDQ